MYRLLIGASYIWNKKVSSQSFHTPFEDFVTFLFLESFYLEKWKFNSLKLNKEKTEKIRDVTKSLCDICKVDIYKDFLKLFCCQQAASRRRKAARRQPNRAVRGWVAVASAVESLWDTDFPCSFTLRWCPLGWVGVPCWHYFQCNFRLCNRIKFNLFFLN